MFKYATETQSFSEVYLDTFGLYRRIIWALLPLSFSYALIASIPHLIKTIHHEAIKPAALQLAQMPALSAGDIALQILNFAVTTFFVSLSLHYIHARSRDKNARMKASILSVARKYIKLLPLTIICTALIFLGMIIVVPAILLAIVFLFAIPMMLIDDTRLFETIAESWHLVWGQWWATFFMFVGLLILLAFSSSIILVLVGAGLWAQYGATLASVTLVLPVIHCFILVQFNNLKCRRDHAG